MSSDESGTAPVYETTPADDESISAAVVRATASLSGCSPSNLPPLYDSVDPGALDELFSSRDSNGRVEFVYGSYEIAVHSNDTIEVCDPDD